MEKLCLNLFQAGTFKKYLAGDWINCQSVTIYHRLHLEHLSRESRVIPVSSNRNALADRSASHKFQVLAGQYYNSINQ